MDNRNRELVLKNLQLRDELEKYMASQTKLLQESIKTEFNFLKIQASFDELLDENIKCFELAIARTKKLKEAIGLKRKEKEVLKEKNK